MGAGADRGDRGETLLELLVALTIMGVAVVVLVTGIGVGIRMSDIHRKQATASAYVRAYAEAIETAVAEDPSVYDDDCTATIDTYDALFSPADLSYTANVTAVDYWDGAEFVAGCVTDTGVQRVSLSVSTDAGMVDETLDVIIRKPCRVLDPLCA